MEEKNLPTNLDVVLSDLKREIFATLNCVQVGRITKVTGSEQSVEVQLQIRQPLIDGTSAIIPVLVDVPFFVLQGGSAFINMPVSIGDYCIVLFNDRDIDTWWTTDGVSDPNTTRKHNLSDGIALVGINPKTAVRDYNGDNLQLFGDEIHLNGSTKTFVTHAELDMALQTFVTALNLTLATKKDEPLSTPGALTIDISAAETTTIKTGG
jgi:hypothetical protein